MKSFKAMACHLYAITVFTSGSEAVASAPGTAFDATGGNDLEVTASYTSGTILVNDNDIEDGKGVVFSRNNTADMNIEAGIVKVGTAGAKTSSGATTVKSGAILQITAASAGSIAGDIEIKTGGIIMVDSGVEIPASGPSYLFLADRVYNLHTNLAENVSAAYTAPDPAPKLHCSLAAGLPVGSTINPSTGTVTLPAPSGSTTSYSVTAAGISAAQADTITAIPTGWTYDSGTVKLSPVIGTASGFPASTTLAIDGTGITLPGGYNAQSDGIHKPNADIVSTYDGDVFIFDSGNVKLRSIDATTEKRLPIGSTINASSGLVSLPAVTSPAFYFFTPTGIAYFDGANETDICLIPTVGFSRAGKLESGAGGVLSLSTSNPAIPLGSTLAAETGVVTLPYISPTPATGTVSYNAQTDGVHAVQADTIAAIPAGWSYDSGAVKLSPAIGATNGFPASTTLAADGGGITLPGGYNAQSDGIHKPNDPIVTKPIGFTFSASGVACDSSAINLAGLPSGSSLSASSADGVDVMLPTGYSFDSANLYNGLTKGAVFPAGFANSNALGSYRKLVDGNAIAQGARDCTDVIVGNLQLRPGAIIKLGAGAKWSRDVTVA
jgi:hypothetical protein